MLVTELIGTAIANHRRLLEVALEQSQEPQDLSFSNDVVHLLHGIDALLLDYLEGRHSFAFVVVGFDNPAEGAHANLFKGVKVSNAWLWTNDVDVGRRHVLAGDGVDTLLVICFLFEMLAVVLWLIRGLACNPLHLPTE